MTKVGGNKHMLGCHVHIHFAASFYMHIISVLDRVWGCSGWQAVVACQLRSCVTAAACC